MPAGVQPAELTAKERRRLLVTCIVVFATLTGCYNSMTPFLSIAARDLGLRPDSMGLIVGGATLIAVFVLLPAGLASDRYGRRSFMVAGMLLVVASMLGRALAFTPLLLMASFMVFAVAGPIANSSSIAAVADGFPASSRARAIGLVQMGAFLGQIGGLLVASVAATFTGWRQVSLGLAVAPLLIALWAWRSPEPPRQAAPSSLRETLASLRDFFSSGPALALSALGAVGWVGAQGGIFLAPFVVADHGLSARVTGLIAGGFVAGAAVGSHLSGWAVDRVGHRRLLFTVLSIAGCLSGLTAFSGANPLVLGLTYPLVGVCLAMVMVSSTSVILEVARSLGTGTAAALGALRIGFALGPTVAPALAGAAYVRGGGGAGFLFIAGVFAVALPLALVATRVRATSTP
jgi:MFS family permease